jgi:1,4-dihydroxy-2-naphthoate octaprenyltransferase
LFFLPIVLYFLFWFLKVLKNPLDANFKNTMKMNFIAAICMNSCFIVLYFVNR